MCEPILMDFFGKSLAVRWGGLCIYVSRCIVKPRAPGWPFCTCVGYLPDLATVPPSLYSAWFSLARPATSVRMFGTTSATPWCKTRHYSVPEWRHGSFIRPDPVGTRGSLVPLPNKPSAITVPTWALPDSFRTSSLFTIVKNIGVLVIHLV